MTTIVAPPSNASKWQMGFNSVFKGLSWKQHVFSKRRFLTELQVLNHNNTRCMAVPILYYIACNGTNTRQCGHDLTFSVLLYRVSTNWYCSWNFVNTTSKDPSPHRTNVTQKISRNNSVPAVGDKNPPPIIWAVKSVNA